MKRNFACFHYFRSDNYVKFFFLYCACKMTWNVCKRVNYFSSSPPYVENFNQNVSFSNKLFNFISYFILFQIYLDFKKNKIISTMFQLEYF